MLRCVVRWTLPTAVMQDASKKKPTDLRICVFFHFSLNPLPRCFKLGQPAHGMAPIPFVASFWRGGTSRGLILPVAPLLSLTPAARNKLINIAMGSGDPRQIDGLGGGVSSLSKVSIVSRPGEGNAAKGGWEGMGVSWADDVKDGKGFREGVGEWDVVWRFGQVGVKTQDIDWSVYRTYYHHSFILPRAGWLELDKFEIGNRK